VVEEAAVLGQAGVVDVGERADEGVGEHDTGDGVVAEPLGHRLADGALDQVAPRVRADQGAHVGRRPQRLGDGGPQALRDLVGERVELAPRGVRAVVAGDGAERGGRALVVAVVDQQPEPVGVAGHGGVRRVAPAPQRDAQPQLVDHGPWQQRHQVGVARQPGVDAGEHLRRHRGAADVVERLEHQDRPPGPGEVGGGGEPVVPAADDDGVVPRREGGGHRVTLGSTSRPKTSIHSRWLRPTLCR
jgi:hypothetical protein